MTIGLGHYLTVAATATFASGAFAQGYLDRLTAAEPAAAALLVSKAQDWRTASEIVKDRAVFMVFAKPFPKKSKLSPNDLMTCLDKEVGSVRADTHMQTVLRSCTQ